MKTGAPRTCRSRPVRDDEHSFMRGPQWLTLLSEVPAGVTVHRKPVASAEQIEQGTAGPIAGWQSILVDLSEPKVGLRHVQITLDENGHLLSGGDHVMFVLETDPGDDCLALVTEHESVGGRFESDGSFRGTYWKTILETSAGDPDTSVARSTEKRAPSADEVARLTALVHDLLRR